MSAKKEQVGTISIGSSSVQYNKNPLRRVGMGGSVET